ncbi:MAG: Ni/Fe hydrogenase subunit alpha [Bryobacterales bacterium]|nr:Ni/Fe hydrogenase subunit alpha [Bryobacterales bacterium]
MKKITIAPVSRIEGHAHITIHLREDGEVESTQFHVTQVRGFEKFVEGRPYYEMPGITARICGICPISHLLASAKTCDALMAVRIPPTAAMLRELIHCAQVVQSHALSFFHLSAPDLLLGMDFDPARRNVLGLAAKWPEQARDGIELRKFGQQIIERLAGERVHPSWIVPGGVASPLESEAREEILQRLPHAREIIRRTLELYKSMLDRFAEEVENFGTSATMWAALVDPAGNLQLYDGRIRFAGMNGELIGDAAPEQYGGAIAEASLADSYMKAPYYRPLGIPNGIYRVGPLARLNVAGCCGTPEADRELAEFRQRFGRVPASSFHYHYARLIEITYALERIKQLLDTPGILDSQVRARAEVNAAEGVGVIEAPRGTLIHHYKVDANGAMKWANLIVATGHNNLAIGRGVEQVARHFIDGNRLREGMLNRVSALVRAFDPCLSCSTHASGVLPLRIELRSASGAVLDELRS